MVVSLHLTLHTVILSYLKMFPTNQKSFDITHLLRDSQSEFMNIHVYSLSVHMSVEFQMILWSRPLFKIQTMLPLSKWNPIE